MPRLANEVAISNKRVVHLTTQNKAMSVLPDGPTQTEGLLIKIKRGN